MIRRPVPDPRPPLTSGTPAGLATARLRRMSGSATVLLPWAPTPMGPTP